MDNGTSPDLAEPKRSAVDHSPHPQDSCPPSPGSVLSAHLPPRRTNAVDPMIFRVDLDVFRGPLDLLLYLVRKHELNLAELPIAPITEQFLDYLAVLEHLDVNAAGDFLEMASTLIEIKSKLLLPRVEEAEDDSPLEDPRDQLVQQLLEYKQYRDAACVLEERNRAWSKCYRRLADDLPPRRTDPADQPIHEVELWDLVSAMGRVLRINQLAQPTNILYDETPIQTYMQRIHERLQSEGQLAFSDMFHASMHKSAMIGVFLAVLELVRHHSVYAEQDGLHGEIYLLPGRNFETDLPVDDVDDYEGPLPKPR